MVRPDACVTKADHGRDGDIDDDDDDVDADADQHEFDSLLPCLRSALMARMARGGCPLIY